tara:strand:+ start:111 stop:926 length:816 start_codon:yes stop_codon:yes gene_type:complete
VPKTLLKIVCEKCQGNPLHAKQILAWAIDNKVITYDDEHNLIFQEGIDMKFPESVKGAILSRLDTLDPELLEFLKVASCVGYKFPIDLVGEVCSSEDTPITADAANWLIQAGFIKKNSINSYQFCQHVVLSCANELLMDRQRFVIHRRIANGLKARGKCEFGQLAHHYEEADMEEQAIKAWEAAAKSSLETYNFQSAVSQYMSAIRIITSEKKGKRGSNVANEAIVIEGVSNHAGVTLSVLQRNLAGVLRKVSERSERTLMKTRIRATRLN